MKKLPKRTETVELTAPVKRRGMTLNVGATIQVRPDQAERLVDRKAGKRVSAGQTKEA